MKRLIYELIIKLFRNNKLNFKIIMANIQQLSQQVAELQASLDAEQQQVLDLLEANKAAIEQLEQSVADLEALVSAGGTEEERQALSDKLNAIKEDLESTVADVEQSTTTTTTEAVEESSTTTSSTIEETTLPPIEG